MIDWPNAEEAGIFFIANSLTFNALNLFFNLLIAFCLLLDEILFKGYTHSKRGSGLTKIPEKVLKLDICEGIDIKKEIKNVFIYHFKDKILAKKTEKQSAEN